MIIKRRQTWQYDVLWGFTYKPSKLIYGDRVWTLVTLVEEGTNKEGAQEACQGLEIYFLTCVEDILVYIYVKIS